MVDIVFSRSFFFSSAFKINLFKMNSVNFFLKKKLTDKPFNYILKKKVNVYAYIYIYIWYKTPGVFKEINRPYELSREKMKLNLNSAHAKYCWGSHGIRSHIYIYIYARFLDQWSIFLVSSNIYTRIYFVELIHETEQRQLISPI